MRIDKNVLENNFALILTKNNENLTEILLRLRGEGGVKHFFYMFIPSYIEFYTESASFFEIKKFQVLFELRPQTRVKKSIFAPLKMAKISKDKVIFSSFLIIFLLKFVFGAI